MIPRRKFLLVDADTLGRFLILKTLLRHYPEAAVQECQDLETSLELVRSLPADGHRTVVIAHRTVQADGKNLVTALRAAHPSVPIVWTAEPASENQAETVGATRFLDRNAWLMIGKVVEDLT